MMDQARPDDTLASGDGMSQDQLSGEQATDLPDREAMSILSAGGLSGPLPVPIDPQPPVAIPDPSLSLPVPPGLPSDVDLTNVAGNVGDISDIAHTGDIGVLIDPRDLADLRDVVEVTGAPVDGGTPDSMGLPPADSASTLV